MSKFRAAVVAVAATAVLVVPASADAKAKTRAKKSAPLVTLKLQVLQGSGAPCALLGTTGTSLLGSPINLCL